MKNSIDTIESRNLQPSG